MDGVPLGPSWSVAAELFAEDAAAVDDVEAGYNADCKDEHGDDGYDEAEVGPAVVRFRR